MRDINTLNKGDNSPLYPMTIGTLNTQPLKAKTVVHDFIVIGGISGHH